ncbi:BlaI/MecI/CopY family transcriptional regulator [Erysipelotrichaceae bacterium HCN-30851]
MKFPKLTKRENEIMQILWNSNEEMSANDIVNASNGISLNTVQQTLQKLMKMNYIHISSIGMNKKALTRLFRPSVEEADYVSSFINQATHAKLAVNFIEQTTDEKILQELSELLQDKMEKNR